MVRPAVDSPAGIREAEERKIWTDVYAYVISFCKKVSRDQLTVASAMVFLHRFFARESLAESRTNRDLVAAVSVFIAAKVRYCPFSLRRAVHAYFELEQAQKQPGTGRAAFNQAREDAYR